MASARLALALALIAAPAGAQRHRSAPPPANVLPLPLAIIDDALAIGGENVAARAVQTRMVVPVRINGQGPFRFAVDSGADTSVIGQRRARALALPAGTPVMLHGTTASSVVDRVLVDALDLGQSTIRALELPVLQERHLGADGLIGIDALVEQRLMLDFEAQVIRIEDARRPAKMLDGEVVVTARLRRGQLILTQARANGRSVDAVIDTGSQITIGNSRLRDELIRRRVGTFTTVEATGVTGVTVPLQIARVRELRLGSVLLQDVPIAFADVPPFAVFGLADRPALLLGTDLMATFAACPWTSAHARSASSCAGVAPTSSSVPHPPPRCRAWGSAAVVGRRVGASRFLAAARRRPSWPRSRGGGPGWHRRA